METIDASIAALQQDLVEVEAEITHKTNELAQLTQNIDDTLVPEYDAARQAYRNAERGNQAQRNARAELKEDADEARETLYAALGQKGDMERLLSDLRSRRSSLHQSVATTSAERARAAASSGHTEAPAPPPPALLPGGGVPEARSHTGGFSDKAWELYINSKAVLNSGVSVS